MSQDLVPASPRDVSTQVRRPGASNSSNSDPEKGPYWGMTGNQLVMVLMGIVLLALIVLLVLIPRHQPAPVVHVAPPAPIVFTIGPDGDSLVTHMPGATNAEKARNAVIAAFTVGLRVDHMQGRQITERGLSRDRAMMFANQTDWHGLYIPVTEGDQFVFANGRWSFTPSPKRHHR